MKNLKIYKASAGSGKTYKLVEEYIRLVFADPDNYQRILAMTFTNKATAEMKSRILSELYNLSKGKKTGLYNALMNYYKFLDHDRLKNRAHLILQRILYDYSHFEISTIDSFFQKVLRNFARELGLQIGYNVELDTNRVLAKAIDLLIMSIEGNETLAEWLIRFAREKIEEGKSWNLKGIIEVFAKEIFKENFQRFEKEIVEKIEDKKFLLNFRSKLNKIKATFEYQLSTFGKDALIVIENNGLTVQDFSFGYSGVAGYFDKLTKKNSYEPSTRILNAIGDVSKWYISKSSPEIKEKITGIVDSDLNNLLTKAIDYYESKNEEYYSTLAILRYFNVLGILTDIAGKLSEIRENENIMLISDMNPLLNDIVGTNDTPFIYEKIGTRYNHFLIDEFQDTSVFQWNNIKPLIKNSLSDNNFNMLVGDVKQSIYRWRGGDWKLLLKAINEEVGNGMVEEINLNYNWRSGGNIVSFNNSFFYWATYMLQEEFNSTLEKNEDEALDQSLSNFKNILSMAYSDSYQYLPEKKDKNTGKIEIRFYEKENPRSSNSWKPNIDNDLPVIIEELLSKNFKQGDITILVRTAKDGREIADILLRKSKYNIISKDSLYLNASPSVRLIVSVIRYLNDSKDKINLINLLHDYHFYLNEDQNQIKNPNDLFLIDQSKEELTKYLPESLVTGIVSLKSQNLYNLIENIINIFSLNTKREELAFIQGFKDAVLTYIQKNKPDISSFLNWWEDEGKTISIKLPENNDAIRIMTIHNAKGLDFKAVIIPYCDWRLDHNPGFDNILWCSDNKEPFNDLDPLPLKYGSALEKTIFKKEYFVEKLHAFMDNLNLLYVSFTRSVDALYIMGPLPSKNQKIGNVADLIYHVITNESKQEKIIDPNSKPVKEIEALSDFWNESENVYIKGELPVQSPDRNDESENSICTIESYFSNSSHAGITVKKYAEHVFEEGRNDKSSRINYGKFMHELLSKIETPDDIDKLVNEIYFEGKISSEEKDVLKKKLIDITNYTGAKDWFKGDWEVKTETPIITSEGEIKIPDRVLLKDKKAVVIDFKFGVESDDHKWQVKDYMNNLEAMGYEEVEGFVYYAEKAKIEKV